MLLLRRARNSRLTQILVILTLFVVSLVYKTLLLRHAAYDDDVSAHDVPLFPESNSSLLDLTDFRYILNSDTCRPSDRVFLIILIHSAPRHFQNRDVIRRTWGKRGDVDGRAVRTAFLLAKVDDPRLQEALTVESEQNADMVQGSFIDDYRNLTYKHVMGLRWVGDFCGQADFVLKMDDDIFLEIFRLVRLLERRYPRRNDGPHLDTIGCYVQNNMPVVRDEGSKWFISKSEYRKNTFDNYCSGWAYLTSPSVARQLANSARYFRFFWVDDVHITGTLARHAGLKLDRLNWCFTTETRGLSEWAASGVRALAWQYIFGPTWGDVDLMVEAHRKATWCRRNKCRCCFKPRQMDRPSTAAFATISGSAHRVPM